MSNYMAKWQGLLIAASVLRKMLFCSTISVNYSANFHKTC